MVLWEWCSSARVRQLLLLWRILLLRILDPGHAGVCVCVYAAVCVVVIMLHFVFVVVMKFVFVVMLEFVLWSCWSLCLRSCWSLCLGLHDVWMKKV